MSSSISGVTSDMCSTCGEDRVHRMCMCAPNGTPHRAPNKPCSVYVGVYNTSDVFGDTSDPAPDTTLSMSFKIHLSWV